MKITRIRETPEVIDYLEKRKLIKAYKKAKGFIILGHVNLVNFKLRQPKERGIYAFRINKQFRALCICKGGELRVFRIDNHQK